MIRTFKLRPSTVQERFGDETVILNLDSGSYYSALGVGAVVWGMVVEGASDASILRHVRTEFSGSDEEITATVGAFLERLVEESLVEFEVGAADDDQPRASAAGTPDKVFAAPTLQKYTDMEEMLLLDPIHEVDEQGWPSARKLPG